MKNSNAYQIKSTDFYLSVLLLIYNDIYNISYEIGQFIYQAVSRIRISLSGISIGKVISVGKIVKAATIVFAILRLLIKSKNRKKLRKFLAYNIESMAYNFFKTVS